MILHRPTLRRAERLGGAAITNRVCVKLLGTGEVEYWNDDDILDLPSRVPATDEEIRLAVCLKLTIREVRQARKGCKQTCGGCK